MKRTASFVLPLLIFMVTTLNAGDGGLVAEYRFDRVTDNQTPDTSRRGNNAKVHGARPIQDGEFTGLEFDGRDDYVDCGADQSLDLRGQVTVECWIRPDVIPDGEVGIAGKGISAFMLTYYKDGQCYWYINDGTNSVKGGLATDIWQYVVGVYDGNEILLYLNGQMVGRKKYRGPINAAERLVIGAMPDRSGVFNGALSQLRIYNTALSAEQIALRYQQVAKTTAARVTAVTGGERLNRPLYSVRLGSGGAIQVDIGEDSYIIETAMSFPGDDIGWNRLTAGDHAPALDVAEAGDALSFEASFEHYRLSRTVQPQGHRVIITDRLTNTSDQDVGIIYRNELVTPEPFGRQFLGGAPRVTGQHMASVNPSLFIAQPHSRLVAGGRRRLSASAHAGGQGQLRPHGG
jgi:Concanavalin A-like lectin/glucanases superfamily